ncbi:MAG TPA: tetratricopeptide repeat protein [Roseiarcus sp.]|nr:tetratricopeptide repeat protein [Roseiarcus sp.]
MPRDAQGHEITGSPASVESFDQALADYYALGGDPVGKLKAALAKDASFGLGATAIAALFMVGGFRADHAEVRGALKVAGAAAKGATPRERLHLEAVETWAEGRMRDAAAVFEEILVDHPTDALALRLAQDAYLFLGASAAMRDSVARVWPEWRADDPLASFVLGARAFGLEETGDYAGAEAAAREALRRNRADAWAAHALAHVFEMTARPQEGVAFLQGSRADWGQAHFMAGHNGWHEALFLIELGRIDEVLAGFDRHMLAALANEATLDRVDAASLLWRLELEGVDVGSRWGPVRKYCAAHVHDHVLAFNDLHLALAVGGEPKLAAMFSDSLDAYRHEGEGDNAVVMAQVGRPLINAMLDFAQRRYAEAAERILPLRYDVWRIGGSHAQREVVDLTLIAAAERAGESKLARALIAERAALRPTARWQARLERARAM